MKNLFTDTINVSELNAMVRQTLEQQFQDLWIAGEISNLIRAGSGHYYFILKDDTAQVRCTLFKFNTTRLSKPLKEGEHIAISGRISLYEARGEFQIIVNEVRHLGLGQLFECYESLKQKLSEEGLFAPERKQRLPENPQTIGVITSLDAAALRDVLATLHRRAPHIPIIIYPTPVQGSGSEKHIASAIKTANQRAETDVLIVCRGGGSIEDLWAFNEEMVVRAVADSRIAIVSGVGHETDFTLTDFVADARAPTPTAAAEWVSPDRREQIQKIHTLQAALSHYLRQFYENRGQKLDFLAQQLMSPRQRVQIQRQSLQQQQHLLHYALRQYLGENRQNLRYLVQKVSFYRPNIAKNQEILQKQQAILHQTAHGLWRQWSAQLAQQNELLHAVSPQHILQRGFAVVQDSRGRVIHDVNALKTGQKLHLILSNGISDVQVLLHRGQSQLFE